LKEEFISEVIKPLPEELDLSQSSPGEPALPRKFYWRKETVEIAEVVRKWKSSSPCVHGSGDLYVRRHWYEIMTTDGREMKIYFDRNTKPLRNAKRRWWMFSQTIRTKPNAES